MVVAFVKLHNGDTSKCNYLSNNRCIVNEYNNENYMYKFNMKK